jgi:TatD DNase family protein
MWIDSHCHLDAPEWSDQERLAVREQARAAGVGMCVLPAVERAHWPTVRRLAHQTGDAYALGIHPLYVPRASDDDLRALQTTLEHCRDDPQLVAVGEIGLDFFVPELQPPALRDKQGRFYAAQLQLAWQFGLPVILHVRRSADLLLKGLRDAQSRGQGVCGGIAHAFNGSQQQAHQFIERGFLLGVGGAVTFATAHQLRRLATDLPPDALVLETDAPDIPPRWLYVTAAERAAGRPQGVNSPAQLPRIGKAVAQLRGMTPQALAAQTTRNVCRALPRLDALIARSGALA